LLGICPLIHPNRVKVTKIKVNKVRVGVVRMRYKGFRVSVSYTIVVILCVATKYKNRTC